MTRVRRTWVDEAADALADTPSPAFLTAAEEAALRAPPGSLNVDDPSIGFPFGFGRRVLVEAATAARRVSHHHALNVAGPQRREKVRDALEQALAALTEAERLAPLNGDVRRAATACREALLARGANSNARQQRGSPGNPVARATAAAVVAVYQRETGRNAVTRPTGKHELARLLKAVGEDMGFKRPLGPGLLRPARTV